MGKKRHDKKFFALFIVCCLRSIIAMSLEAGNIIVYDFSTVTDWTTEPNGSIHPKTGTSALITEIYNTKTNDCFVGKNEVYFSEGYLMLKPKASLKIPYHSEWTINKIILHSHKGCDNDVNVNIYTSHDGSTTASTKLTWNQDADHEYEIKENRRKSVLYIRVANSNNARITSIAIEYNLANNLSVPAPTFSPSHPTFNTESLTVEISTIEGCEIYYTTDGSTPSYTDVDNYNGTKGDVVTIYASSSPITLKAIAVDPTTGAYSEICSATYEYIAPTNPDDSGSESEDPTEPTEPEMPEEPNDGSNSKPFTVADLWNMSGTTTKADKWIIGTIYGTINNSGELNDYGSVSTSIVIGDATAYAPIQLPQGDIRNAINLREHPYLKGKFLKIKGNVEKYEGKLGLKSPTEYEVSYSINTNHFGYASLYLDMPVEIPTGCTAYYCTTEGDQVHLHPVGDIIPDSTGVIISYEPNSTCKFIYTTAKNSDEENIIADNQLVGFAQETTVGLDGYAYYALNAKNEQLGFYIPQTAIDGTDASAGFTAKAYKAYLQIPKEHKVAMFVIHYKEDETEIVPTTQIIEENIFDLQGRTIANPTQGGIYIRGGRKIIIK